MYWSLLVIFADQMFTHKVITIDHIMHADLPKQLDSGDQTSGPTASPAIDAESYQSQRPKQNGAAGLTL
jgi:hypothetical protein